MKRILILLLIGTSIAVSCQLNEIDIPYEAEETFYAAIENSDVTRTTLKNGNILWSSNDQISIFRKNTTNSRYQVTSSSVGKNSGTFTKISSDDDASASWNHNVAIYPYQESLSINKKGGTWYEFTGFTIPDTQKYVQTSFSSGAFPMVAFSTDNELTFKNVCGGINLQLKGTQKVMSIEIRGKNNEKLSGDALLTIHTDGTAPSITMTSSATTSVTLNCNSGVQLNETTATEFIITLCPVTFTKGFTATVTDADGMTYTFGTDKSNTVMRSSLLMMPAVVLGDPDGSEHCVDGFDDPENGVVILQNASKGSGTDIVIMGDGFIKKHFVKGGQYHKVMQKAYEDFFSVEPYASLKEYFNVYYINVMSKDAHDAVPYYDSRGNQNGATQGKADTKLGTQFTKGSTSIEGDNETVLDYAVQAIKAKGAANGGECTEEEAHDRAYKSLVIVLSNVKCRAGTCVLTFRSSRTEDYGGHYSIAYCALGNDATGRQCQYILIHEAGGHGFGKLGDEYSGQSLDRFNTKEWYNLRDYHDYGVDRNINEYWTPEEASKWNGLNWEYTTESNVYWSDLLDKSYGYKSKEGLGIYGGANTYSSMFCRPSKNSVMRDETEANGQYFNAISRWAIWYRVMRLTQSTTATSFKASLDEFIDFDRKLTIIQNKANEITRSDEMSSGKHIPLAPPVLIEYE